MIDCTRPDCKEVAMASGSGHWPSTADYKGRALALSFLGLQMETFCIKLY